YAADVTAGQFSVDRGRLIASAGLKTVGNAVLKSGEQASLHEFAALVNCELAPGVAASKQLKPHMDFVGGPPRTIFRNWDLIAGNYALGGATASVDRSPEIVR